MIFRYSAHVGSGPQRNLTIAETPDDLAKAGRQVKFRMPELHAAKEYEGMWLERRTHKGRKIRAVTP